MKSIRQALLWRFLGGAFVLFLAAAALLQLGVGWLLTKQFDATLRTKLATFTTLLDQEGYDIEIPFVDSSMPQYSVGPELEYFEIWVHEGAALYRSESLAGQDLPKVFGTEGAPVIRDATLVDGRAGRLIGAQFQVHEYEPSDEGEDPGPAHLILVLAAGRGELDDALRSLFGGTLAGLLVLVVAGVWVSHAAVKRSLMPLDALARYVNEIDDPLNAPHFPSAAVPLEIAPLVENHNALLDRIARAFETERRTTANIAHELRTPIAELVILTETTERHADDPAETQRRLRELREISSQMSALISTLFELARMESGSAPLEIESIDLAEMVRSCWITLSANNNVKGVRFQPPTDGPHVPADRVALSILLSNLLSNAMEHAPPGDDVRCEIEVADDLGSLTITNSTDGLSPEDVDKLTEPFWRASSARDDRSHAGLGLSLVARLATLLEFDLSFNADGGRFGVRLEFPVTRS